MPKTTKKKLNADTGAEVSTVVQAYLKKKKLDRYMSFNFAGLQRLEGPVKIEIIMVDWTPSVGGTVMIKAKGADGTEMETSKSTVKLTAANNFDEVQDALTEAGLLG